ncbi:glycerate kinase [Shewanella surugensis]|uniref:Glycerate kinase n=1 Tax=Shewanella surugensis TaxID=212020 RepID=A0ABT0LF24_9GAMM|nr:glycerate kinase [Shewanella surugensis]MCL1126283.1 glycerate kinase [Shewanella surugensis]
MKIVIAPDSFKESLTAIEVANEIEKGFREVFPHAQYINQPIADGGEGTVDVMVAATNGQKVTLDVTGPLGASVSAYYGILGNKLMADPRSDNASSVNSNSDHLSSVNTSPNHQQTAVIEVAKASGLHLIPSHLRHPDMTTSYGTGELILDALNRGIKHIILGLGGSATNDGGAGILSALGIRFLDKNNHILKPGGIYLKDLCILDTTELNPLVNQCQFELACDVTNPLCGKAGASHIFGPQKGADAETANQLDNALSHFADIITQTGREDHRNSAGAGAAGGIGFGLMSLTQATLKSGIDIVMEITQLSEKMKEADLVITGEGCLDSQTLNGKAPMGVTRLANQQGINVIAIGGSVSENANMLLDHGLCALFAITPGHHPLPTLLKRAKPHLYACSRNIAALYKIIPKKS